MDPTWLQEDEQLKRCMVIKTGIHTNQQLADFLAKE